MIGGERELLPSQRRNGHEHNVKIEEEMFMDQKNNGVFVLIVNYFLVLKPPQTMIHVLVWFWYAQKRQLQFSTENDLCFHFMRLSAR